MPIHEDIGIDNYITTPVRAERMQLLAHLLRNTSIVPYLRGDKGVGKTWVSRKLADTLDGEFKVVWLRGGVVHEVPTQVCEQLSIATSLAREWPEAVLRTQRRRLLIIIDDANVLGQHTLHDLALFQEHGGALFLVGSGQLIPSSLPIEFVDLPPLEQIAEASSLHPVAPSPEEAANSAPPPQQEQLHLQPVPKSAPPRQTPAKPRIRRAKPESLEVKAPLPEQTESSSLFTGMSMGAQKAIVGVLLVLILALWFQEKINALFEDEPKEVESVELYDPEPENNAVVAIPRVADEEVEPPPENLFSYTTQNVPTQAKTAAGDNAKPVLVKEKTERKVEQTKVLEVAKPKPVVKPKAVAKKPPPKPAPKPRVSEKRDYKNLAAQQEWIRETPPQYFTLQLVGGRDARSLAKFVQQNGVKPPYAVFRRDLTGAPWYSLVAGEYATRDEAIIARSKLPWRLKSGGVWPRTFESIQQITDKR